MYGSKLHVKIFAKSRTTRKDETVYMDELRFGIDIFIICMYVLMKEFQGQEGL